MTVDVRTSRLLLSLALLGVVGCQSGGEPTHAVSGRVEVAGGDAASLAGHLVEFSRVDDTTVRASGLIGPDGRFTVEALDRGERRSGAKAGQYQARLVLVDEGDGRQKKPKLPARYLDFKTSGWTIQVPTAADVTLRVAAK